MIILIELDILAVKGVRKVKGNITEINKHKASINYILYKPGRCLTY